MVWDVSPEIFSIGPVSIRYYSLLFLISFLTGIYITKRIFKIENYPDKDIDDLLVYVMIGTIVGARLGHVLFYNPGYYLSNPVEILKVWEGGLASHGAAVGNLLALYLFTKKKKIYHYLWLVDRVVISVAFGGALVRLGNFFNSEIIGAPTDLPWAIVFKKVDMIPRHPSQLYESLAYLLIFLILLAIYNRKKADTQPGFLFVFFLAAVFGFRFFVEFLKENQEAFEAALPINMGQILSIPLVLVGLYMMFSAKNRVIPPKRPAEKKEKPKK